MIEAAVSSPGGASDEAGVVDDVDRVVSAMRSALTDASKAFRDPNHSIDALIAEALPFVESAQRAARESTDGTEGDAWREVRSFVWLLAYRLGDQAWPGAVVAGIASAWRDALATAWARARADEIAALLLEGYARGREERVRTEAQKGLAAALPVQEIAPGIMLIVAAGQLDADGATALADRASSFMLRRDAKAALLDLGGLVMPASSVLVELWAIASSARTLGVKLVVSGVGGVVGELVAQSNLHDEGEIRVATLTEGIEQVLATGGGGASPGFIAWVRGLWGRSSTR